MDLSNRSNKRFHDDIVSVLQTVRSVNIPEAAKVDDSCPDDCVLALNHIKSLLTDSGYAREALAIDNALDHCLASKDDGGLGFSLNDTTTETIQEAMLFQVDIWLEALNSEDRTRHLPKGLLNVPPGRRPMTLTEKILVHHSIDPLAVEGPVVGEVLRISVDWVVTSELAWAGLYVGITKAGVKTVFRNDRIWIAGDHRVDPRNYNTPLSQKLMGAANKAERAFKLTENKGANFTIMHTEFVRQKALPGTVVIGADSHTCSSGAVGCLAIGLGVADVAIPVIAGETWFRLPECIKVSFVGNLLPGIGGKDIILHILGQLKRNTVAANRVVEFSGPGLCQLSIDARFAICNMCTELGAITGIFVPDEVTKAYVDNRKAKHGSQSPLFFSPDEDACYAETFEIDLGSIMPFIALYPSPDNVVPVTEALGTKLDGCFIGACTTTEEDLVLAALVLKAGLVKGMPLATGTRHVTPGSLPIVKRLKKLGLLSVYEEAGFSQGAPGCSYCVGVVDVASPGSVWLSSQNRNFQDRMGKGAIGNLASAITVAASSFSMTIADPIPLLLEIDQTVWSNYQSMLPKHEQQSLPGVQLPRYVQPDFVHRSAQSPKQDLNFSVTQEASKKSPIEGKAIVLGDFVDTDALAPSEFLTSATTDQELGEHCMQYAYPEFREKVKKGLNVVVAGKAFGVGSSREQAPRALKGLGVECVVARSFAFIYARNQPNVGLLGIVIDDDAFYSQVTDGAAVEIDMDLCRLCVNGSVYPFRLDNLEYAMIERGGLAAAFAQFGKNMFGKLTAIAEKSRTEKTRSGPESCEEPAELQW